MNHLNFKQKFFEEPSHILQILPNTNGECKSLVLTRLLHSAEYQSKHVLLTRIRVIKIPCLIRIKPWRRRDFKNQLRRKGDRANK